MFKAITSLATKVPSVSRVARFANVPEVCLFAQNLIRLN